MNLILRDAHLQQIAQHGLHGRITQINLIRLRCVGSAPVGRRGGGVADKHPSRRHDALRRTLRLCVALVPKESSQSQLALQPAMLFRRGVRLLSRSVYFCVLCRPTRKRSISGVLVRILLSLVHLLLELLRLFLVRKTQPRQAVFQLKAVKKGAILVVAPRVVDLLVPYDAAVRGRDVDQLDPEGVTDQIVREHGRSLQSCICPSSAIGVRHIQARNGHGVDLVARFGHGAFDSLLVLFRQYRRHFARLRGCRQRERGGGREMCSSVLSRRVGGRSGSGERVPWRLQSV
jgi:hypothetical protein